MAKKKKEIITAFVENDNEVLTIEEFILSCGSDDLDTFGGSEVGGVYCQQIPDELAPCLEKLIDLGVVIKSYFEVGVAAGGTTYIFNHYFHPEKIVLLDNNQHPNFKIRPDVLKGINYQEVIGDSQAEETANKARELAPYDFMVLDAVHSYQATKIDVALYTPMLSKGGYLFLHDSVWSGGQVDRVVRELKTEKGWEFVGEFITKFHKNPCGIAIFRKV